MQEHPFSHLTRSFYNVDFTVKNSRMISLLLTTLTGSSLVKSLTIDVNSFTFVESAPITTGPNVFVEVPILSRKGSPRVSCGAHCGLSGQCIGMEVCGAKLCRLWNGKFNANITVNLSSGIMQCLRFLKNSNPKPVSGTTQSSQSTTIGTFQTTSQTSTMESDSTSSDKTTSTSANAVTASAWSVQSRMATEQNTIVTTETADTLSSAPTTVPAQTSNPQTYAPRTVITTGGTADVTTAAVTTINNQQTTDQTTLVFAGSSEPTTETVPKTSFQITDSTTSDDGSTADPTTVTVPATT